MRFIPAWAGNRRQSWAIGQTKTVHPRVGGEQSFSLLLVEVLCGSSPRGRGTVGIVTGSVRLSRFIPAWAGNS